jgi:hypothetical protein
VEGRSDSSSFHFYLVRTGDLVQQATAIVFSVVALLAKSIVRRKKEKLKLLLNISSTGGQRSFQIRTNFPLANISLQVAPWIIHYITLNL